MERVLVKFELRRSLVCAKNLIAPRLSLSLTPLGYQTWLQLNETTFTRGPKTPRIKPFDKNIRPTLEKSCS